MSDSLIERTIRATANAIGIDILRYRPERQPFLMLCRALASRGVDQIFDVGANEGQFARAIRRSGYSGTIVSFEPSHAAHSRLQDAARNDSKWYIAERAAVGERDGTMRLNISANSVSSSLLPMLSAHVVAAPESEYVASELVPLVTLDSVADAYLGSGSQVFVKIDTQGYEHQVVAGAKELLRKAVGVQLELSWAPMYAGQLLAPELIKMLGGLGFVVWSIWPGLSNAADGRMLQCDAVFLRDGHRPNATAE